MSSRSKKFLSYYRPYLKLFLADMFCAMIAAGISLVFPIIIRYITGTVLVDNNFEISLIYKLGVLMIVLVVIEYLCNYFVAYKGHVMGVYMERDLRNELFQHYQKLSFSFYDEEKTGQLMSRLTNDLFSLTELYHHGPEDIVISFIKFFGAFVILANINLQLTLIIFAFIPVMGAFIYYYNRKMKKAFKANRRRVGDINARIEDNLSGIRVVKSFANENYENNKFNDENNRYVNSKSNSYFYMGKFHSGLGAFTSMITLLLRLFLDQFLFLKMLLLPCRLSLLFYCILII
ncbi:MAG: ABC transporter ATP-binding protein [Thomasclavelia sp.]